MENLEIVNAGPELAAETKNEVKMVFIPKVVIATTDGGKKYYSAKNEEGVEMAHEIPQLILERALAAQTDPRWKNKVSIFLNTALATPKWVRVEKKEDAIGRLTPKATTEATKREEKPKKPTLEIVAQGLVEVVEKKEDVVENKAEEVVVAKAEDKTENKAENKAAAKGKNNTKA